MPRVLLVDDETNIRKLLTGVLGDEGYETEEAATAERGLEVLRAHPGTYDAVLLDLALPGMDGLAALEQIRALPDPPVVLMMSGHGTHETAFQCAKNGAFDYIEKPIAGQRLLLSLERALGGRRDQVEEYKLMHPLERVYFFCTPFHPSSFHLLAKQFHEIYPSHRKQTPPVIRALMHKLADAFGERRVDADNPDILQVGWITQDSAEETTFWQTNSNSDIQLFMKVNPGYRQGHGLLTLVRLTLGNLFFTVIALAKRKLFALLHLGNAGVKTKRDKSVLHK